MATILASKRQELLNFIRQVLEPEPSVQAVIAIGSLASGHVRPDSDIDAIIFFDPLDWYVIPAEFIWLPDDGTFHSIFSEDKALHQTGIQIDCRRLDLNKWSDPSFNWPEGCRAEFSGGWIAFDRDGSVGHLISERTTYSNELRRRRLDDAITWIDQHLHFSDPLARWHNLGPAIAHDRLQAAFQNLVEAFFAYNHRWIPWRNRQMGSLLQLKWLPVDFEDRVLVAANAPNLNHDGYVARLQMLRELFDEFLAQLINDGLYKQDPVEEAFIKSHDQPGYAWNMAEWNEKNHQRLSLVANAYS